MEKVVQNSGILQIKDFIEQINEGNYHAVDIPVDLTDEHKEIFEGLNRLCSNLSKKYEIQNSDNESSETLNALKVSEYRYRTLVESAPFCIHEIDLNGDIISMNQSGLDMLGLKKTSEVCGTGYLEYVDKENKDKVNTLLKHAFDGKQSNFQFNSQQGEKRIVFRSVFIPIWNSSYPKKGLSKVSKVMGITQDITESVANREALLRSKESLKMVIDNIDEIVYAVNFTDSHSNDGVLTYLSPQVENVLGYQTDDFINNLDLWYSLIHTDDIKEVEKQTKRLLKEKISVTRVYRLKQKSGNYLWFEDKISPRVDFNGHVSGFIGSARDITERKQTEQALSDSEEKYRTFFEKAPIGIGLADKHGDLLAFNDAILEPGNYTREDTRTIRNVEEFYYDLKSRDTVLGELKSKGFVDKLEILFKKKDGSPYPASLSLTPLVLEGEPYTMALVQDLSENKKTKDALTESESRNKTIVENVQEAILIFESEEGTFIDFNKNAINLFGYSEDELKNMTPAKISPEFQPDGKSSQEAAFDKISLALNGESQVFEWMHGDKEGRNFPCEVHLTSIPYKDRQVVMGSIVDISKRKQVENERENLIRELDRFVYSASHDLSAPLKSILGLLNITRMEANEPAVLIYIDKMEQSINKLEDFIGEIIQYSRNSRLDTKIEPIELESLTKEILEDLKFSDGYEDIDFIYDFDELPHLDTDRFRLKVVLNNLLSNSIKFHRKMRDEKPFIKIKAWVDGNTKYIDIIDNGQGITEENLNKIFDMFYRGSHSSSGSGLGLYIAKEAAHNIDGDIKVKSEYGKGSTFCLVFNK
jgi:PAS domain S-box-containing protein